MSQRLPKKADVRTALHDIRGFADLALKALSDPTDWNEVEQWLGAVEGAAGLYRDEIERAMWGDA